MSEAKAEGEEFWLFGYGSLIWKPPPHYDRRVPGYVEGYVRRFWQHTETSDRVWGAAYRIEASKVKGVQEYLNIREINGYSIQYTPFWPSDRDQPSIECLVYIGLPDNPQFLGPQDPPALAEHIRRSKGPSGENVEYLFMLEQALKDLGEGSGDGHVQDLANKVRMVQSAAHDEKISVTDKVVEAEVNRIKSGESGSAQEELED